MGGKSNAVAAPVIAAGAVIWRTGPSGLEVCLVHRPRYHDWTIPKGKLDDGESVLACATREAAEETGHRVTLGMPLPTAYYEVNGRPKTVHYWAARADGSARPRQPDAEVDIVSFVSAHQALAMLSYEHDRRLVSEVAEADPASLDTSPLVIVRHASAVPRSEWQGDDDDRPLNAHGHGQAQILPGAFAALGATTCISSPSRRCVDTVRPWAEPAGIAITRDPNLSEDGFSPFGLLNVTERLRTTSGVVCSHRPVLPDLLAEFGLTDPRGLRVGEFVVAHRRGDRVVATERHIA